MPRTEATDILVSFLQCFIFTILKVRQVYDASSFHRCRVRHLGDVWWNHCVEVEDYVVSLCESLRAAMNRNRLKSLTLHLLPELPKSSLNQRYVVSFPRSIPKDLDEAAICEARSMLVNLEMRSLPAEKPGSETWKITLETWPPEAGERRQEALPIPRWCEAPTCGLYKTAGGAASNEVLPLGEARGADGSLCVSMYIEEGQLESEGDVLMVSSQDETPRRRCVIVAQCNRDALQSLRRALVSPKIYGAWRCAPNDNLLRINFASKKLITSQEASRAEVYAAMQKYASRLETKTLRSYNGLVGRVAAPWSRVPGEQFFTKIRELGLRNFLQQEGGLVQVKDFLPEALAEEMLEMLKTLPQEEWLLSENQSSVDADHRFWRYEGSKLNQVKTIMQDESGYWKPTGFGVWALLVFKLRVDL
eukprot:symbB.v1.2.013174.t1/scaffold926.1/size151523/1